LWNSWEAGAPPRRSRTGWENALDHYLTFATGAPWFAGWGTLALVNAALAQGKNRSGLLWFVLSLLLGPFATLLLVLLPKVRSKLF